MRAPLIRLCCLLLLIVATSASPVTTVIPNANTLVEGDSNNRFPFLVSGGIRSQQIISASQFAGAMSIGQIALRNDSSFAQPFTTTISSIQISLSTVAANADALN